ncbi:hypothetical protein [Lacticaseibacillus rhamnosus]|uniref:hypothetical protein n=1 Tax=Lacticaseibacillus rhamnosus TaxID=47715 RepID=UPI0008A5E06E|nr:hypothetical protein [Lacticaseibacillus rhamnosus]MDK7184278.1 hypothetical protein [Lacticaseibacillus rhamnosus]MDK7240870.1 hypothetical protein [Lacticaseibacillus rhamnosus]MDT8865050.1 hypothetical protein [Lacticaseibacillus rhamnosus]OFN07735.1 hypothetical protein HMPREF2621_05295 [Lactobacillus sp. HMSC072E07]
MSLSEFCKLALSFMNQLKSGGKKYLDGSAIVMGENISTLFERFRQDLIPNKNSQLRKELAVTVKY